MPVLAGLELLLAGTTRLDRTATFQTLLVVSLVLHLLERSYMPMGVFTFGVEVTEKNAGKPKKTRKANKRK
jgi:hypothetical protein